jgi:hypothetical protein
LLKQDAADSALPLDGRDLATVCGRSENAAGKHEVEAAMRQPASPGRPSFHGYWSWRGSQDYRAAYLAQLRERFPYVLIDCPSLKESTEVLGLAPLVDGVLLWLKRIGLKKPSCLSGAHDRGRRRQGPTAICSTSALIRFPHGC